MQSIQKDAKGYTNSFSKLQKKHRSLNPDNNKEMLLIYHLFCLYFLFDRYLYLYTLGTQSINVYERRQDGTLTLQQVRSSFQCVTSTNAVVDALVLSPFLMLEKRLYQNFMVFEIVNSVHNAISPSLSCSNVVFEKVNKGFS